MNKIFTQVKKLYILLWAQFKDLYVENDYNIHYNFFKKKSDYTDLIFCKTKYIGSYIVKIYVSEEFLQISFLFFE